jgi:hypothetical protein
MAIGMPITVVEVAIAMGITIISMAIIIAIAAITVPAHCDTARQCQADEE